MGRRCRELSFARVRRVRLVERGCDRSACRGAAVSELQGESEPDRLGAEGGVAEMSVSRLETRDTRIEVENGAQTTRFVPVLSKSWDAALPNPGILGRTEQQIHGRLLLQT